MAEKVTADKVEAKAAEQRKPTWTPVTLVEHSQDAILRHNYKVIEKYEAEVCALKAANTEHISELTQTRSLIATLKKVAESHNKDLAEMEHKALAAMREADAAEARFHALLNFIKGHPLAKDIDFSPLFS